MNLNDIYTEIITEHNQSNHNKKELLNPDYIKKGVNPSCGDDIELSIIFKDDKIFDMSFSGIGCAISHASASVMIDLLKGKSIDEAKNLTEKYLSMIKREIVDEDDLLELEEAIAFKNISNMPARVKCAVLAWHTFLEILSEKEAKKI